MAKYSVGDIQTAAASAASETRKKITSDPNRAVYSAEDRLLNLVDKASVLFEQATLTSVKSLNAFIKAVDKGTNQFALREAVKRRTPSAANLALNPELQQRYDAMLHRSSMAKSWVRMHQDAEAQNKRLTSLTKSAEQEKSRREGRLNRLRDERAKLEEKWIAQDQQNFKLGKARKIQPMGITSMAPLPTGKFDKEINIATDRALAIRRANYLGGGVIGGGGGMGGRGGGGGWWSSNNLPVPARYPNLPSNRFYAGPPQTTNNPVGPYIGQQIFPRRVPTGGGGGGSGIPWGALGGAAGAIMGLGGTVLGAGVDVGMALWEGTKKINRAVKPAQEPLDESFRAAMATGQTNVRSFRNAFGGGAGGLGVSSWLNRAGYESLTDASKTFGTYSSAFRPRAAFMTSTMLANGPEAGTSGTGAIDVDDWQKFFLKMTGMGMNLSGGGIEKAKRVLTDSFAAGAKQALPPTELFENMNRVLDTLASTGQIRSSAEMMAIASSGANLLNPAMRDVSAQTSAIAAYSNIQKNITGGTGLYYTSFLSESKRVLGTTNPTGEDMQKFIDTELGGKGKYTLTPAQLKYINENRTGPLPPGMASMDMLANAAMPSDFIANTIANSYKNQLSRTGITPGGVLGLTGVSAIPPGAKTAFYASHGLGGPTVSGLTPLGTDTTERPLLAPGSELTPWSPLKRGEVRPRGGLVPRGLPPLHPELMGGETGGARAVAGSAVAMNLDAANAGLNTFGNILNKVNGAFDKLFVKISHFTDGDKTGTPGGLTP